MTHKSKYVSVQETRAQVTREKLLKSAIKLVHQNGMKQLTVRNVCEDAGLSTGSFYNLFSGKEELVAYYLKYAFLTYKQQAEEEAKQYNPIERVLLMYRFYLKCCKEVGLEFVSALYASNLNPFFDFMHRDSDDDLIISVVRQYINEGKEAGLIREEVDTNEALLRIAAASTGLLFYWCVFDGKMDIDYQLDNAIKTYLLSIATDPNMEINLEPIPNKGCFE